MAFKRMEGFAGSVPQKFGDERMPLCPFCGTNTPHWAIDQKMGKMLSLDPEKNANKYLYQCEQCKGIVRVPTTDVVGVGRSALLSWQGVAKKARGKDVQAIYVTLADVGSSGADKALEGKEMTLDELNAMAQAKAQP